MQFAPRFSHTQRDRFNRNGTDPAKNALPCRNVAKTALSALAVRWSVPFRFNPTDDNLPPSVTVFPGPQPTGILDNVAKQSATKPKRQTHSATCPHKTNPCRRSSYRQAVALNEIVTGMPAWTDIFWPTCRSPLATTMPEPENARFLPTDETMPNGSERSLRLVSTAIG